MEKIKVLVWSFMQISRISVRKLILKILLAVFSSVVPVIIVIQIGKIIDLVIGYAEQGVASFNDIVIPVLILAGLMVANSFFFYGSGIVTSFVNVSLGIRLKRRLIDCVRWFPAQSFLDNSFCDEYENASSGIDYMSEIADNLFSFVGSLFSFVLSLVVIARVSIWFAIPVVVFFIVGYRMNMRSK
jgi:ABC-type multidrug transport system fused ATPase/permease subunit